MHDYTQKQSMAYREAPMDSQPSDRYVNRYSEGKKSKFEKINFSDINRKDNTPKHEKAGYVPAYGHSANPSY